ncbi:hypothetical protein DS832_08700 [Bombilactobacillus bombi]|uniref:Uncharacterized protein n=1 Tax=Bombilactobacillus bombi TaxID=1303590 RepID=A0A3R6V5R2_9LACO|nr:hypothetical protein [Bombilactobacillus bombi]RHW44890.1 hypothetical protein DS832_08700 [Bombilactobacillus bombi]
MKFKIERFIILFAFVISIFYLMPVQPVRAEYQVRDQQQILTPADIQKIHDLNQKLAQLPHPQQIWVRTYRKVPSDWRIYDNKKLKNMYKDNSNLEEYRSDTVENTLPKVPEIDSTDYDDYEEEETAQKHADQIQKHNEHINDQVNIVIVYPVNGQNCVALASNENVPIGDFQLWYLHRLAPRKINNNRRLMKVVHKYNNFIQRHNKVQWGNLEWDTLLSLWSFALIVWFVVISLEGLHDDRGGGYDDCNRRNVDGEFEEGYMYGYWQEHQNEQKGDNEDW